MAWTRSLRPFLQAIQKGVAPSANRPGLNGLELLLMRYLHTSTVSATEMKCWNKITIILGAARKWKSTPGTFLHRNDLKKWIKQTITQEQGSIKSWMDRTRKIENFALCRQKAKTKGKKLRGFFCISTFRTEILTLSAWWASMIYLLLCSGGEASATTKSGVLSAPFMNSVRISGILTILIHSCLTLSFLPPACGMVFRRLEFLFSSPLGTFRFFSIWKAC